MNSGHIALRKGRHSANGQIYLVTFTTAHRQPHFTSWEIAVDATRHLTGFSAWTNSRLLARVLMPDHWHGLIELDSTTPLATCIQHLKGRSARYLGLEYPNLGRIWATGYHDRALRKDEDLVAIARYVVMNPVRAGLVSSIGCYPFWDAIWI